MMTFTLELIEAHRNERVRRAQRARLNEQARRARNAR
jgi:hypothetical protein